MDISGLLPLLTGLQSFEELLKGLPASAGRRPLGLPRFARAVCLAGLHQALGKPILLVVPRVDQAHALTQELASWVPDSTAVRRFPEPTPLPFDRAPWGTRTKNDRLSVLALLHAIDSPMARRYRPTVAPIVVSSLRALIQKTLPPREFLRGTRQLHVGQVLEQGSLMERWLRSGYNPATVVEEPGTFSRRGGILDVCPPGSDGGVRVEFFGNQVESLRRFDLTTQRTLRPIESVVISPACELLPKDAPQIAQHLSASEDPGEWREDLPQLGDGIPFPGVEFYLPYAYARPASLIEYLPEGSVVVVDDWGGLEGECAAIEGRADQLRAERESSGELPPGYPTPIFTWEEVSQRLENRRPLVLGGLVEGVTDQGLAAAFRAGPRYGGQVKPLIENLLNLKRSGERVVVVSRQAGRLAELWAESAESVTLVSELVGVPPDGTVTFVHGTLGDGFFLKGEAAAGASAAAGRSALNLFTDAEIFGWARPEPRQAPKRRAIAPETPFADIAVDDYVVHIDHGIGRFGGLVTRSIAGNAREYLLVTYANSDQLYVPVHQADRLSRYVGSGEQGPSLNRLGGLAWAQAKARVKREIEEIADELLELYAARETVTGYAFSPDSSWQAELEASFPYLETDDQFRAIREIKQDMERPRPMDRLICGDVGFGKTEVALRAAFKAVMDGKQVGVLVPTTVLAQQHYNSFSQRLAAFPVDIRMLSRFRSRQDQARILQDLVTGKVDIVIGTHRLLQKDVVFGNLGLIVVDEEQRFGVAHKELLKQLRTEVDVLTMTATPIPRTLYMSLTGVRDISLIATPPEERLPVQTHVGPSDDALIRKAILRELDRGGQVFFVHNRVQTINSVARRLQDLVPEARFGIGHGQMGERDLEQIMLSFVAGEVDVLVSTSIIENGLDIPNANTIIIDNADWFGLSQLYQLRGRVGRGARRAYCYALYRAPALLTAEARARLETIAEHTELGAGYSIAMRDLEIRGAGEILGSRQHGHIASIGFDLYTRLLSRAVQLRKERDERDEPSDGLARSLEQQSHVEALAPLPDIITIELPLDSYIPDSYIPEAQFRFRLYRRMAGLTSLEAVDGMAAELADRFGPIPDAVDNLLYQLRVKLVASRANVLSISPVNGQLAIRKDGLEALDRRALQRYLGENVRVSKQAVWLRRQSETGDGSRWRIELVQTLERLADWRG